jgi:hypothetical protein
MKGKERKDQEGMPEAIGSTLALNGRWGLLQGRFIGVQDQDGPENEDNDRLVGGRRTVQICLWELGAKFRNYSQFVNGPAYGNTLFVHNTASLHVQDTPLPPWILTSFGYQSEFHREC